MRTLHVVLHGGPGVGKSTVAAGVFARLKERGVNCEFITEVAKDLTWERHDARLAWQPLIHAEQVWRMQRLEGQVEVTVSDGSPLTALMYGDLSNGVTSDFEQYVIGDWFSRRTLPIQLIRAPTIAYIEAGRNQTADEALEVDKRVDSVIVNAWVGAAVVVAGDTAVDAVLGLVDAALLTA